MGTMVMVENTGKMAKDQEPNFGPCEVVEFHKGKKAYRVLSNTGKLVPGHIIKKHLTVLQFAKEMEEKDKSYEVQRVDDHYCGEESGVTYYLTKWKGAREKTWVPEDDFDLDLSDAASANAG